MTNVHQVSELENVLSIQQNNGLELPEWSDSVFPDDLLPVRIRSFQLFTETPYMKRIKGGPLITEIFNQLIAKQNGDLSRKVMIFSAHDKTLANVMSALDVSDQTEPLPDFGATLVFELFCGASEECTVNVSEIFIIILNSKRKIYFVRLWFLCISWYIILTPTMEPRSNCIYQTVRIRAPLVDMKRRSIMFVYGISPKTVKRVEMSSNK